MRLRISVILLLVLVLACSKNETDQDKEINYKPAEGVAYIFENNETVPEMHISVSLSEWNRLLSLYDANPQTRQNIRCDITYVKNGEEVQHIQEAALHLRGNTSRRRPEEGNSKHRANATNWNHVHFALNFHKYHKDAEHELHGQRKLVLKWFHEDPTYVREPFCYDLFRRAGVWTATNAGYVRLYLHVEGDKSEVYYGIYGMYESVDDDFVKVRKGQFGDTHGYLWKCRYGATLQDTEAVFGTDEGGDTKHVYELKYPVEEYAAAKAMLKDFIYRLNTLEGDAFKEWIEKVFDVPLLMKTYAVNVAVGMWDDYWCNKNNYYLYFRPDEQSGYKVFFIPYDYDNTLGTSQNHAYQTDCGRQDPFNWGPAHRPLIYKILQIDEYREIYRSELLRLIDPAEDLMCYDAAVPRILEWQAKIRPYVSNEVGEDMQIADRPASWGNHPEYRVYTYGANNWFTVKAASLREWLQ